MTKKYKLGVLTFILFALVLVVSALQLDTFTTSHFSGSGTCAFCHSNLRDSVFNDVSIDSHWRSTMLANSSKDPFWQAKVSSEVIRNPIAKTVIEEKCARCHMPMAHVQATSDSFPISILNGGFLDLENPLHRAAMDGVSCTLCHQIESQGLGLQESFTGAFSIDTSTVAPDRIIFGPYQQPFENPMLRNVGFRPFFGPHIKDSGLCGTCHTLYTPILDASGTAVGSFPEQMTYLEWEHSSYSKETVKQKACYDCHMPLAEGGVVISDRPNWLDARSPFSQHHFVGGNVTLLNILKSNVEDLNVSASSAHLDATITRALEQLQKDTAKLTFVQSKLDDSTNTLTVTLKVRNKTGHKLPTGIPCRRLWIHLWVKDADGNILFESGKPARNGKIRGNNADVNRNTYENHYDIIDTSDKVQIYEVIMLDQNGAITYTLLNAAQYAKDNRLLPAGFRKASADQDIAVWGDASSDENFRGGSDKVTYTIAVSSTVSKPLTVSARLLFQPLAFRFVKDLRRDSDPLIKQFGSYYDSSDKMPVEITKVEKSVQ